jgi:hypothetical protein
VTFLLNTGVPVWIERSHAIAHNKIMLPDRQALITGSFNSTKAAEIEPADLPRQRPLWCKVTSATTSTTKAIPRP